MPRMLSTIFAFLLTFAVFTSPSHAIPTTYTVTPFLDGGFSGTFVVDIDGTVGNIAATSFSFTDAHANIPLGTITDSVNGGLFSNQIFRDGSDFGISNVNVMGFTTTFGFFQVVLRTPDPLIPGLFIGVGQNGASIGQVTKVAAAAPVPAPSAMTLLGFGLVGLGVVRRRRKQRLG